MQNFFELFNLPMQFDLDIVALEAAYRNVQRLVHPDRFVTASDAEKRAAVQYASLANDAYQTLRNPLKRAMHLCTLNGIAAGTTLMTIMQVRSVYSNGSCFPDGTDGLA